ncbi:MAG: hypothetical protein QM786_12305 [Breznakibacter sp.]
MGQLLGFRMLDYNIAFKREDTQQIGCISKSMVRASESKLTEGKDYLVGYNPNYNPETDQTDYTFQFICDALKYFNLEGNIPDVVKIIVFDTIVGNSDRHQENWGFITNFKETIDEIDKELNKEDTSWIAKLSLKIWKWSVVLQKDFKNTNKQILKNQSELAKNHFSPIYDSGCCLGRELTDNAIDKMLKNHAMLKSYVSRGLSEIHWQGIPKKQKHFDLVNLLMVEHSQTISKTLERVKEKYNKDSIRDLITRIDQNLPQELLKFKLSDNRKELMAKIISLRTQQLLELS